tara:strand:+ start:72 stop:596 length:525 start_codon:yes stop_codon:yes gene_type:complete
MTLGKNKNIIFFLAVISLIFNSNLKSDDKISTVPLINLENLKPSFEENDESINLNSSIKENIILKEKKNKKLTTKKIRVNIVALDKITAKTSDISLSLGEIKKFGLLEIKALKCGEVNSLSEPGQAAYIQVKDVSDNENNKVFVFNGWTFSSSPTLKPLDHPVYDLWLVNCDNV